MTTRAAVFAAGAVVAAVASLVGAFARPTGEREAVLDGAALFVQKACASCHSGPGRPSDVGVGPPLVGASSWAGDRIAGLSAQEYLTESMTQPAALISPAWAGPIGPSTGMPLLQLSTAEVDALVDYLLTAPPAATG